MPATNKVTVGMPVYNDPSGLLRSVPTVFNQTWGGEIRLLIVDDGSSDDTREAISALQEIYRHIDVIRNDENQGRPYARNQILDNADDPYLAWLDSGDLWHPRKLETQFGVLGEEEKGHEGPILCTSPFRWVFADKGQEQVKVPDTSGDQLHDALTSKLPPYLWTLLGRTSAFRSAGHFDERLPRRQDYEFFVRFIEQGGHIVSTPADTPLATYMKTDVGRSPAEVATANRVIRTIHSPLYARYGRGFERQMRRRQLVLEARFHENNGDRLKAMGLRTLGWFSAPTFPSLRGVRGFIRRWWRRFVSASTRALVRLLKPFLPLLRRFGVTTLLRRMVSPEELLPRYYQELEKNTVETDVAEGLEVEIANRMGPSDVAAWLRLEQAYRRSGQLGAAEGALERGRRQHPESSELKVRLVELMPLARRWDDCVRLWTSLSPTELDAAGPTTYNRAAWAYRELDDPHASLQVLESGLDRWHGDRWLLAQFRRVRALSTDWARSVSTRAGAEIHADGLIKELGFLHGANAPVKGWVGATSGPPPTVDLIVNDTVVTSTKAAASPARQHVFSFNCTGLLEYLGDGDIVLCETQGLPVPIQVGGDRLMFHPGFESNFEELRMRLANGYVFENLGKLVEGNTTRRKKSTLRLYDDVRALIEKTEGYVVYPMYGNLLGAIRENDFIPHDVGGFDVVYVSRHVDAKEVRTEFGSICRALVDHGYHLKVKPWSAYVRHNRSSDVFVDLNFAWFNEDDELNISYGWRYAPVTDRQLFSFPREAPLGSRWVPVPGNAEALLDQVYGPSWITPNQGYVPEEEMKRDDRYLLSEPELRAIEAHNPDLVVVALDEPTEDEDFNSAGDSQSV